MPKTRRQRSSWARIKLSVEFEVALQSTTCLTWWVAPQSGDPGAHAIGPREQIIANLAFPITLLMCKLYPVVFLLEQNLLLGFFSAFWRRKNRDTRHFTSTTVFSTPIVHQLADKCQRIVWLVLKSLIIKQTKCNPLEGVCQAPKTKDYPNSML